MLDTIDENKELNAPNLVPPDHVSEYESMVDDHGTTKAMIFKNQFPLFSSMEIMFLMMKSLMMMDHKKLLFKWILKDLMHLLMKMPSMSFQDLKPQSIQKY